MSSLLIKWAFSYKGSVPFCEFALLAQLARHAGRVLTHAHLLNAVWGPKAVDQAHYLRVHFAHLRRKLRAAGLAGEVIRNEPGIGYRLPLERS